MDTIDTNSAGPGNSNTKIAVFFAILVLAVSVMWAMAEKKQLALNQNAQNADNNAAGTQQTTEQATLTLIPSASTVTVNQEFSVDVMLDTAGMEVDGVDITYLRFDPKMLQVIDSNGSAPGLQISAGPLMSVNVSNLANNTQGTVQFSQITSGGQKYVGSGKLATIKFKAVSTGKAEVSIDFEPGKTADTNISSSSKDVLENVNKAVVEIK